MPAQHIKDLLKDLRALPGVEKLTQGSSWDGGDLGFTVTYPSDEDLFNPSPARERLEAALRDSPLVESWDSATEGREVAYTVWAEDRVARRVAKLASHALRAEQLARIAMREDLVRFSLLRVFDECEEGITATWVDDADDFTQDLGRKRERDRLNTLLDKMKADSRAQAEEALDIVRLLSPWYDRLIPMLSFILARPTKQASVALTPHQVPKIGDAVVEVYPTHDGRELILSFASGKYLVAPLSAPVRVSSKRPGPGSILLGYDTTARRVCFHDGTTLPLISQARG